MNCYIIFKHLIVASGPYVTTNVHIPKILSEIIHGGAPEPLLVKLESRHITFKDLVRREAQTKNNDIFVFFAISTFVKQMVL